MANYIQGFDEKGHDIVIKIDDITVFQKKSDKLSLVYVRGMEKPFEVEMTIEEIKTIVNAFSD